MDTSSSPPIDREAEELAEKMDRIDMRASAAILRALGRRVAEAEHVLREIRDVANRMSCDPGGTLAARIESRIWGLVGRMNAAELDRDTARIEVERLRNLIGKAQRLCTRSILPASDRDALHERAFQHRMVELLDGPEERAALSPAAPPETPNLVYVGEEERPTRYHTPPPTHETASAMNKMRAQVAAFAEARCNSVEAFLRLIQADPSSVQLVERRSDDGRTTTWTVEMLREPVTPSQEPAPAREEAPTVSCNECAFRFGAEHVRATESVEQVCPVCSEVVLNKRIAELERELRAQDEAVLLIDVERDGAGRPRGPVQEAIAAAQLRASERARTRREGGRE